MKKLNKSFTVTFTGAGKKGKVNSFQEVVLSIPKSFLEEHLLRLEESSDLQKINLYFMNGAGEWVLVAGTDDPSWEEFTKDQKEKEISGFRKQIRKVYNEVFGSQEN